METKSLTSLLATRVAPSAFLQPLIGESVSTARDLGLKLVNDARDHGLDLKGYLQLKVDPTLETENARKFEGLDGYEATLAFLNLPIKNDLSNGVVLQAAAETFQTFPGTRALFPQVVDDVVRWAYRQDQIEKIDPILANSRTVNGTELLSTVIDDTEGGTQVAAEIAEGSRIPVKAIRSSEHSVRFYKHGLGYRTTYEFNRRVSLDILTPYAQRALRELDRSKLKRAVGLLVNGDSVYSAAPSVDQSSFNAQTDANATNGKLSYQHVLAWLVSRAQAGVPIDTVVGNWDSYFQWQKLFAIPTANSGPSQADISGKFGFQLNGTPLLSGSVKFAVSSDAPANKLIGFSKGDTLEELVEAGSLINESERAMQNQTITYYRTENSGFRLVFGDTRSIFNYNA